MMKPFARKHSENLVAGAFSPEKTRKTLLLEYFRPKKVEKRCCWSIFARKGSKNVVAGAFSPENI